ncbi:rhomboid family intramembrane serine protease [Chengkuizengella axinellae]|uniref:Rhomboid family intramembrane serine protease n=1 Tax=Chengkuizengella axinellae TaxID=3064388 RepID=A0ABT9J0J7_9BACL|nr:rhomboid family intramembrane serine protease [Chengkuizengella sp. 2205SS18-9]MDP5274544.1 rhomboid family intramembrane serine protease [Chengkuizengella sp. 2205SS18-9]
MIFLRYESFRQYLKFYPITVTILGLNFIVYLITVFLSLYYSYGLVLYLLGSLSYSAEGFEIWRIFTSMFLHGGFDHFLFNAFSLFLFGPPLERMLGKVKYIIIYLASGVFGNIISIAVYGSKVNSVGASGAIYGLLGAYLFMVLYLGHRIDPQSRTTIIVILTIGIIYSFISPGINISAHLGGLFAGFIIFSLMIRRKSQ